jgi:hypothetical protein
MASACQLSEGWPASSLIAIAGFTHTCILVAEPEGAAPEDEMTDELDLNALRRTILANRARGQDLPRDGGGKIYVHKGKIVDRPDNLPERELSEIHQGTFAVV